MAAQKMKHLIPSILAALSAFLLTYLYPEQGFKIILDPELYLAPTGPTVPFDLYVFAVRMASFSVFVALSLYWLKGWFFRQSERTFIYLSLFGIEAFFLWFEYMEFWQATGIPGFGGPFSNLFYQGFAAPMIFLIPNLFLPAVIVAFRLRIVKA